MSVYVETFVSPFEKDTEEAANELLNKIRDAHPESSGWEEVYGIVEKLPNGKWRAVRKHKHVSRRTAYAGLPESAMV